VEVITRTDDHVLDPSSLGLLGQGELAALPPPDLGFANSTGWAAGLPGMPETCTMGGRRTADCTACLPTPTETRRRMTASTEGTGRPLRRSNVAETDAAKTAAGRVIFRSSPPLHVAAIANGAAITSPATVARRSRGWWKRATMSDTTAKTKAATATARPGTAGRRAERSSCTRVLGTGSIGAVSPPRTGRRAKAVGWR
jgi:hypothetical protein